MNDSPQAVVNRIDSLHIKGFRSLADVRLDDIPNPMVLLGANGAGKSNVLLFFRLLKEMSRRRLGEFVQQQGGANDQVFGGRRLTLQVDAAIGFRTSLGHNHYSFALNFAHRDQFYVTGEVFRFDPVQPVVRTSDHGFGLIPESSGRESGFHRVARSYDATTEQKLAADALEDSALYQFHDTSDAAPLKMRWDAQDNHRLLAHGGNLAPVLIHLRQNDFPRYELICRHIRRVLPEFDGFDLGVDYGKTLLRWRAKSTRQTIGAHLTSDGTLRAMCLVTLLNLPSELLPKVILLDEPELGLHPFAVSLVSDMVKAMARERQVIVATQSPYFVDAFSLDEIVVLVMRDGKTEAKRFADEDFSHWLEEHTTGELWWMNLLGGYP